MDAASLTEQHLEALTDTELELLAWELSWRRKARPKQLPPDDHSWTYYGVMSGRGFGKTLTGANWIGLKCAKNPKNYGFVVSPTHDDVRYTCFEGPTGLFNVIPHALIADSNLTLPSITLYNGSILRGFAGDSPERMRGPQSHWAWCDEISSWRYPDAAWSNLEFGLRLGEHPQLMWTGTPKPNPFVRNLVKMENSIIITGSTYENRDNLAPKFFESIAKYEGTKLGRQEIYGEIIDPEEAGIVKRSQVRLWPHDKPLPIFQFIILSLDTAFTEDNWDKKNQETDPSAATVWGVFEHEKKLCVMLLDAWEDNLGFPDLVRRVKKERELTYGDSPIKEPVIKTGAAHTGRKCDLILIEDIGSGKSLRQQLGAENILAHPYNPGKMDKLMRLHAVSPMFAHNRVWMVESAKSPGQVRSWAEPVLVQLCSFVGEGSIKHDDLMDTTTQALKYIMDRFAVKFTVPPDPYEKVKQLADEERRRKRGNPYG